MDVHVIYTIARQVNGDTVFVRGEGGYTDMDEAEKKRKALMATYSNNGQWVPIELDTNTAEGTTTCMCLAGGFTIKVDGIKNEQSQST